MSKNKYVFRRAGPCSPASFSEVTVGELIIQINSRINKSSCANDGISRVENYRRPITITSTLDKLLETYIKHKIENTFRKLQIIVR